MAIKQIHHYELQKRLGTGAFGAVYYATDTRLMRPVVIKLPHRSRVSNEKKRLKQRTETVEEARIASAIEHPNVCPVYEVGEYEGSPFIVMPYVPGQTLKELIKTAPLSLRFTLSIGIQIADGLAAAHKLGILHRDLKPANVMITGDGVAKIMDFGLARRKADQADLAADPEKAAKEPPVDPIGSTLYMAPEQFVTYESSEQSDLYALGVILYEMATGRHPFPIPTVEPVPLERVIQHRQPARPRTLRPDLPEALEEVILKALAKRPADRFAFASELRDALKVLMRSLCFEAGVVPGEASAMLPSPAPKVEEKAGLFSALAGRLLSGRPAPLECGVLAVVPFQDLKPTEETRFYGFALADTIATRLARLSSVVVRPLSALLAASDAPLDPVEAGRRLQAERVLSGSYVRSEESFTLNWQLLDVASKVVRLGGTAAVSMVELAALQSVIAEDVVAALRVSGEIEVPRAETSRDPLPSRPDVGTARQPQLQDLAPSRPALSPCPEVTPPDGGARSENGRPRDRPCTPPEPGNVTLPVTPSESEERICR